MNNAFFSSIAFPICSLFFVVFIVLMYVNKKKYKNIENTLFITLLSLSFCCIFTEVIYVYFLSSKTASVLIKTIACKTFLVVMATWIMAFLTYVLALLTKNQDVNIKMAKRRKIFPIVGVVELIAVILIIILKVDLNTSPSGLYTFAGDAVLVPYILGGLDILLALYAFVFKEGLVQKGQRKVVVLAIAFLVLTLTIQFIFPELDYNIQNFQFTMLLLALYFTLENQDNKILVEHEEQRKQAEQANKEQTEFLTSMSHEIRTPMNTIIGFSDALIREGANDEQAVRRDVKSIHSAAITLLDLINNILDLSRVESQKEQLVEKEFKMTDFIVELDSIIRNKLESKSINYELEIDPNLPQIIQGDYIKINKVVSNLMSNVAGYTTDGDINLKISGTKSGDVDYDLFFVISSNGSSISEDEYNKYYVGEEKETNKINSVVLDLNVAKMYAQMLNSEIQMTNKDRYNIGYSFGSQVQVVNPTPIGDIKQLLSKNEDLDSMTFDGKKALVVDDNTINIKLIERFLNEVNITVESVTSGNDCINKVKGKDYDVILLDHMMPTKDGIQTLSEMKDIKQNLPPVIALTANSFSGAKEYYENAGFQDYLAKPVSRGDLISLLAKYIK